MKRWLAVLLLPTLAWAGSGTHQVTVGTSAVQVDQTDRTTRISISIKGQSTNAGLVYCTANDPSVTTGTGWELSAKEGYSWNTAGAPNAKFYCIASQAAQVVSVEETNK